MGGPIPKCISNAELIPFCDGNSPWVLDSYQSVRTIVIERMLKSEPCSMRKCMLKALDQTYLLVGSHSSHTSFSTDCDPEWKAILTEEEMVVLNREKYIPLGIAVVNFYGDERCTVEWVQTLIRPGFGVFRTMMNKLSYLLNMYMFPGEVSVAGGVWARGEKVWRKYLGETVWENVIRVQADGSRTWKDKPLLR